VYVHLSKNKDMNTTTAADLTAAYVAARLAFHASENLQAGWDAQDEAEKIARKARRAGVELDEITLDEQARKLA
jgi:hypothetical protein